MPLGDAAGEPGGRVREHVPLISERTFVDLICAASSRLAAASADRISTEVRWVLEAIREFMDADQCGFLRTFQDRDAATMVERVAVEGVPPVPTSFEYGQLFPLTQRTVVQEMRPHVFDRLDDLPADETVQRATCEALGLQAVMALPIVWSGEMRYSLALGCTGRERAWPRDRIALLQALGEIIAGALERQEDERRVRRQEADLAEAQRVARMGSWVRDLVADHFAVSDEAARILGSRPASSAEWRERVLAEDRERVADEFRESLRGATTYRLDYRIVRADGEVRSIVDEGEIRYHAEGHASSAIGTIRDVTDERRTESELRALRGSIWHADRAARAGALGSSLSHELGQPLTAILANAQAGLRLLASGPADTPEILAILEAVVRDDKRAIAIIDGLRALLRKDVAARTAVDVGEAVGEVVALLRGEIEGVGARVAVRLQPGCMANAAKAQVQQVVLNLLSNALESVSSRAAEDRRIEVELSAAGGSLRLEVRDSGRGIAPERMAHIFEPFGSTRAEGLGLGLAISRSIVESHDGSIGVEANGWGGATFRVALPAIAGAARSRPGETDAPATGAHAASEPQRADVAPVCLVDDDASVRESLGRLLRASGHAVAAFPSGALLLASPELARAACVVLDVRMAEMPGPELQRRISERHPWLPIVFLTAHGDVKTTVGAMRQGAVDFLLKPVDDTALLAAVARAVRRGEEARTREAARDRARARLATLSPRERDILELVIRGRLNKQIADELGISEATVKQHRGRVMEKTRAGSVAELVRLCETAEEGSYQGRISTDRAGA